MSPLSDSEKKIDFDFVQEYLIRAACYQFAVADYEGVDSISLNGIIFSDILSGKPFAIANEVIQTAQSAGIIEWDSERIGAVRLTTLGIKKFFLIRRDLCDEDENEELIEEILNMADGDLFLSKNYMDIKKFFTGLSILPGERSPASGAWHSTCLNKTVMLAEGEFSPFEEFDLDGNYLIWSLLKNEDGDG
ncbi:MAG: hypothetical protein V4754_18800 [Pseudomonadota bacterium]